MKMLLRLLVGALVHCILENDYVLAVMLDGILCCRSLQDVAVSSDTLH
jgi:hypothetical protein